jgi:SREBP regulating gene protein
MSPSQDPEAHMATSPRGFKKEETGYWSTPFDYCQSVCRTTSRSTQHENAFISNRRFCFAGNGRPYTPTPKVPPLPKSVTAVVGPAGFSCDAICKDKDQICNSDHFAALNDCNTLRAIFMCEAGCGPSEFSRREFPGYVVDGAPKNEWPAFCFTYFDSRKAVAGLVQQYNCSAFSEHVQRMCPCESAPGLVSQAGQIDALTKQQQQKQRNKKQGVGAGGSGSGTTSDSMNSNAGEKNRDGELNAANSNDYDIKREQQVGLDTVDTEEEGAKRRKRREL